LHGARKFIHYKKDIRQSADIANVAMRATDLQLAMKQRSRAGVEAAIQALDALIGKIAPPAKDAGWRENVEVFLVAIVVAAGIKAYLLQPFRIPTGSMQPTLYGIVGVPSESPPPNTLVRAFEFVWLGRHYFDLKRRSRTLSWVFVSGRMRISSRSPTSSAGTGHTRSSVPRDPLARYFSVHPGRAFQAGDTIARGHMDTGDQVFVDKVSYNFVKPSAGDVFVFKTTGIRKIEDGLDPALGSQHYIKRLAGMPGQTLRIAPSQAHHRRKSAGAVCFS